MSDEKTEKPTRRRRKKAREDGQVAKSSDLTQAVTLALVLLVLALTLAPLRDAMTTLVKTALDYASSPDRSFEVLHAMSLTFARDAFVAIAPAVGASMIGALVVTLAQAGDLVVSMKPVVPDFARVSPAAGLKRIFSKQSLIDIVKMTVKAVIVGAMVWHTFRSVAPLVIGSMYQPLGGLSRLLWESMLRFVAEVAGVLLLIGFADYYLQAYLLTLKLRMSKDEVRREHKEQEGDPMLKGERKRLGREMAMGSPRERMSSARLLVVNPTHYAVAIRYAPEEHPLPRVVAKGADEHAAHLRRLATEVCVPIIGNAAVARRLFNVEVDAAIPPELFDAVAVLLRWVQNVSGGATTSSPPR